MSAVFAPRWRLPICFSGLVLLAALSAAPAKADSVSISVDQAKVMKLPERAATIVIGNPLIADATLQPGGILVVTGKSFGATNMVALDKAGRTIMNTTIQVLGPSDGDLVVVYKGIERETYSCTPDCEHRITLGDSAAYFSAAKTQAGDRTGQGAGPANK